MPIRGTLSIDKAKKLINFSQSTPLMLVIKYINWYRSFGMSWV